MAKAVKVESEAKSRLEELQAEIRLRTGKKVTQQELLSRLIEEAYESHDELIEPFQKSTLPLSEDEVAAMNEGRFDSGVEMEEDDIDEILYG